MFQNGKKYNIGLCNYAIFTGDLNSHAPLLLKSIGDYFQT